MKKPKFTEAQIVFAIKQSDNGVTVSETAVRWGSVKLLFTTGATRKQFLKHQLPLLHIPQKAIGGYPVLRIWT